MKTIKINKHKAKVAGVIAFLAGVALVSPTAVNAAVSAYTPPCTGTSTNCLDRRLDSLEAWVNDHENQPQPTTTVTVTASPTTTQPTTTTTAPTTSTTTVPTTSTTTVPTTTTTTTAPPSAWPDASTTGVPAGTVLTNSGGLTITTPGTVIDGKNITGMVSVNANNVTIKNSRISTNNSSEWVLIRIADGVTGTRVERVEINGGGVANTGIYGTVTAVGLNIHNIENGLTPDSNSVIRDSWIHNLRMTAGDPHYDGIEIDGGGRNNILIEHNYINMDELGSTATVMLDNYFGSLSDVTVNNNKLIGGGYTVYIDGRFGTSMCNGPCGGTGGPITNVKYTNNRIDGGQWGYASIDVKPGDTYTWSGNVDDSSGALITNP